MSQEDYDEVSKRALALFSYGQVRQRFVRMESDEHFDVVVFRFQMLWW